jgi:hypothetical protein
MNDIDEAHGFWLIELDEFTPFLRSRDLYPFAKIFLGWLAIRIDLQLKLSDKFMEITVIEANYTGAYPCLAARNYKTGVITDEITSEIMNTIMQLLKTTNIHELLKDLNR